VYEVSSGLVAKQRGKPLALLSNCLLLWTRCHQVRIAPTFVQERPDSF
jgi:hypothetical protein